MKTQKVTMSDREVVKVDRKKIGKKLVELRGTRTQKEVAQAIKVCQSTYSMYEKGERLPSDEVKKRIAKYYKCSVQFIFYS
jgi:DNA-binding XRE family transcriptional regulator